MRRTFFPVRKTTEEIESSGMRLPPLGLIGEIPDMAGVLQLRVPSRFNFSNGDVEFVQALWTTSPAATLLSCAPTRRFTFAPRRGQRRPGGPRRQ